MTSAAPAMAGTARGDTNEQASTWLTPASRRTPINRTRSSTGSGSSACRPSRGPTSRTSTAVIAIRRQRCRLRRRAAPSDRCRALLVPARSLDGRHAVAAGTERPVLGARQLQPGDQLVAQVLGGDDSVDNQL